MNSVFKKIPITERLSKENASYGVIVSDDLFSQADFYYSSLTHKNEWSRNNITHWLEEIKLPTEEDINFKYPLHKEALNKTILNVGCRNGANFILSKLKGENNE